MLSVGDIGLTRVGYFDVALDPGVVGLTRAEVAAIPWAVPDWATPEGDVLVGQAVWAIEAGNVTVIVDPCGAADAFLRTGPDAVTHERAVLDACRAAGIAPEAVDFVVLSHLDGIGMAAAADGGPLFPRARVVVSRVEFERVRGHPAIEGAASLLALAARGVVDEVESGWQPAPGVTFEVTGGHSAGHAVLRIGDGAVFLGHLAVSPLNAACEMRPGSHEDREVALVALERELAAAAHAGRVVIGPLWPAPGAGQVSGPPWMISPRKNAVP